MEQPATEENVIISNFLQTCAKMEVIDSEQAEKMRKILKQRWEEREVDLSGGE